MKTLKLLLSVALALVGTWAAAQEPIPSINPYLNDNTYTFNALEKVYSQNFFNSYKNDLGLTPDDEMEQLGCYTDSMGKTHCRYRQRNKGYVVELAEFLLHGEKGLVYSAAGNLAKNLNVDVSSPITESDALSSALANINAISYRWQDSNEENVLKELMGDPDATYYPKGELLIGEFRDSLTDSITRKLAWKFQISSNITAAPGSYIDTLEDSIVNVTLTTYVDALTGDVLRVADGSLYGTYGTGTALTWYDGWKYIRTWRCDACFKWRLVCDYGNGIFTHDGSNTGQIESLNQQPNDGDNNWDGTNSENILGSCSAHWAIQTSYEYYNAVHGYNGSDNTGRRVHIFSQRDPGDVKRYASYNPNVSNVDEIKVAKFINGIFGGDLDIMAHEYTHGFVVRNSKLNNDQIWPEAGALNEGFADIFGIMVKRRQRGYVNWKIGEGVAYSNPTVRDFSNPHASTMNGSSQPAKYHEPGYWNGAGEVHINAGVLTHWFYLLANGGTYNGVAVNGLGIDKSDVISFITMMWWLWGNSNYTDTRNQSLEVAKYYWGECSTEYKEIQKAWTAVGVSGHSNSCGNRGVIVGPWAVESAAPFTNVVFHVKADGSPAAVTGVVWNNPPGWMTSAGSDNFDLQLDAVSDFDSKQLTATVTYADGITEVLTHIVHFSNMTGLRPAVVSNLQEKTVSIYPNPVKNGKVNILIPDGWNNDTRLTITSVDGRMVQSVMLSKGLNTVDADNLNTGIYIFKISSGTKEEVQRVSILKAR